MLSIPSNPIQQYKTVSIISGACLVTILQYISTIKLTIHPNIPHTLLLLIPVCAVINLIKNSFISKNYLRMINSYL
nr:MAG TPA: hypothetical protein [Caudoviricetes sp.]